MILMYAYFSSFSYNSVSFLQKLHTIGLPFDALRGWGERMGERRCSMGEMGGGGLLGVTRMVYFTIAHKALLHACNITVGVHMKIMSHEYIYPYVYQESSCPLCKA